MALVIKRAKEIPTFKKENDPNEHEDWVERVKSGKSKFLPLPDQPRITLFA